VFGSPGSVTVSSTAPTRLQLSNSVAAARERNVGSIMSCVYKESRCLTRMEGIIDSEER